jgi:TRAP-type transport system small permease protein
MQPVIFFERIGNGIVRCIEKLGDLLISITSLFAFLMAMLITVNVILRYGFNKPLGFETEAVQIMLITFLWWNQAFIFRKERYISVDFIFIHFSPLMQMLIKLIGYTLGLIYFAVITRIALGMVLESYEIGSRSVYISRFYIWPQQLIVALGAGVLCLQLMGMIVHYVKSLGALNHARKTNIRKNETQLIEREGEHGH